MTLFENVQKFFADDGWRYTIHEENSALHLFVAGESGKWPCLALVREEHRQIIFYSILDVHVPMSKLAEAAEYLMRANSQVVLGNFELDFDTGEVRYKTSASLKGIGARSLKEVLVNVVYPNLVSTDEYLPGLMKVLFGKTAPRTAMRREESSPPTGAKTVPKDATAAEKSKVLPFPGGCGRAKRPRRKETP